jgi:hypothetical protein
LHLRFNDLDDPRTIPRDTTHASTPVAPRSRCCRRSPTPKARRHHGLCGRTQA